MLATSSLLWNVCRHFLHSYASPSSGWQNFFLMRCEVTFKNKKGTLLHEQLRIFSHLEICDFRTFPSACVSHGGKHWRQGAAALAFVGKQNFVQCLNAHINKVVSILHPSGHLSFERCFQGAGHTGTQAVLVLSARRAAADVIGSHRLGEGELQAGTLKLTRTGAGNEMQRASPNRVRRRRAGGSIFQVDEFQGWARRMRRRVQETLGGGGGGGVEGASGRI